jgi:hypothetical protein
VARVAPVRPQDPEGFHPFTADPRGSASRRTTPFVRCSCRQLVNARGYADRGRTMLALAGQRVEHGQAGRPSTSRQLGHPAEQAPHIEAGGGLVLQQRQDGGLCLPLPSGTALARGATSNAANIDSHNRHYGKYCRGRPFLKALGRAATQGCSPQAACAAITTRGRQRRHQLVPWAPPAGSEPMGGPRRRYFSGFS